MKSLSSCVARAAAALLVAAAAPAYGQGVGNGNGNGNNGCRFDATGTTGLNFGALDPSAAAVKTVTATVLVGDCAGGLTMLVSVDQGQRLNRTMIRTGGAEVIPYSVSTPTFSPGTASGPGVGAYKAATFTGTVRPSAYMDAVAGTYGDTLIVTVTP